jgi:hypothetical protein
MPFTFGSNLVFNFGIGEGELGITIGIQKDKLFKVIGPGTAVNLNEFVMRIFGE